MEKYKVSVCVPVYNTEPFLKETLDSLLNQTLKEIEIVCVNDGSTDHSLEILKEYEEKYQNIKVISQENQGLGGARNTGIDHATGEYVGFFDSDDLAEPEMYETLYNLAKIENADISMCNSKFYPENVKTTKKIWFHESKGVVDGEFLNKNTQPTNKIVRRQLLDKINFRFYQRNGDGMFVIAMIMANKIVSTKEKFYNYRIGHTSMSTDYQLKNFIISIDSIHEQIRKMKELNLEEQYKDYFEFRLIYALIQGMTVAALKNDKKYYEEWKRKLRNMKYKKNKYVKSILKREYSFVKYIAMIYILPLNFTLSKILTNLIF